ncbi:hypothetical protein NL676_018646 [Syzygium grande]|nr:hypothetical protein NL676_018646 [Syzygium grande]
MEEEEVVIDLWLCSSAIALSKCLTSGCVTRTTRETISSSNFFVKLAKSSGSAISSPSRALLPFNLLTLFLPKLATASPPLSSRQS